MNTIPNTCKFSSRSSYYADLATMFASKFPWKIYQKFFFTIYTHFNSPVTFRYDLAHIHILINSRVMKQVDLIVK